MQTLDFIRYAIIAGGFIVIGFNIALFRHADQILLPWKIKAWRWYLLGDTGFVLFIIASLYDAAHNDYPMGWRTPVAALAMTMTICSIIALYRTTSTPGRKAHEL